MQQSIRQGTQQDTHPGGEEGVAGGVGGERGEREGRRRGRHQERERRVILRLLFLGEECALSSSSPFSGRSHDGSGSGGGSRRCGKEGRAG